MRIITKTIKEVMMANKIDDKRLVLQCFYCNRVDYLIRKCYDKRFKKRYLNKDNSSSFGYYSFSDSNLMSEKDYKKKRNRRRFKLEKSKKEVVHTGESKRRKLILEDVFKNFKETFDTSYSEIKYCKLEKCKIETEAGKKFMKRGQIVAQELIEGT